MIAAKRKILSDNCQLKTLLCFTETIGFKQWLQDFASSEISFYIITKKNLKQICHVINIDEFVKSRIHQVLGVKI